MSITKMTAAVALSLIIGLGTNSCIEETFPESSTATAEQIAESPAAKTAMRNAVVGYINAYDSYGSGFAFDFGYSAWGLLRDVMCEDFYVSDTQYDYFTPFETCVSLDNVISDALYYYYYKFLNNPNNLIRSIDLNKADLTTKQCVGVAHVYRALIFLDMARFFEFKKTGIAKLDNEAAANKVYGLTVPIVTEKTTEAEAANNPRAPYQTMYKYILDELETADKLLSGYTRPSKDLPNTAVVAGLKARTWLELGTHFEKYPADLAAFTAVRPDITSAKACYAKAAQFAREAITSSGAKPLTESEWFGGRNYFTAFNSIQTSAWMWGSIMKEANVYSAYANFTGTVSVDQDFGGVASITNRSMRTISKALFDQIPDADWRKATWLDPADAGKVPGTKYHTLLNDSVFQKLPAYVGLKFKPNAGNTGDFKVGAAADYPLMRVEEMYFIEAEALAAGQGVAAGVSALESFMKTYRYDSYKCKATSLADFRKELMLQKRIEFWGEGIVYWDYKRLELKVTRGYPGTNCPVGLRLNSLEGYCAPWFNIFFSKFESLQNKAVVLNPNPSSVISDWTGQ